MTKKLKAIDAIALKYITAQASLNQMIALNKQLIREKDILLESLKIIRNHKDAEFVKKY